MIKFNFAHSNIKQSGFYNSFAKNYNLNKNLVHIEKFRFTPLGID